MSMTAMDLVNAAKQQITEISLDSAVSALADSLVLDVREPNEFDAGHLPNAVNIPRGVLEFKIDSHPDCQNARERSVIVYCQTGGRAALATESLQKLGFSRVVSLAGGFKAWSETGHEVV